MGGNTYNKNLPLIKFGRRKEDPIEVIGEIPGDPSSFPSEDAVKLTMEASPDAWHELYVRGLIDPEKLGKSIFLNFSNPVYESKVAKEASGSKKRKTAFMIKMKKYVAAVYASSRHYASLPYEQWDEDFKEFLVSLNINRMEYERRSIEKDHDADYCPPATWVEFGFQKRPDWWGYAKEVRFRKSSHSYHYRLIELSYNKILQFAEEDQIKVTNPKTNLLVASRMAHWAWKLRFEDKLNRFGLDKKEGRLDFKETYLDNNHHYIKEAKAYLKTRELKNESGVPFATKNDVKEAIEKTGAPKKNYRILNVDGGFVAKELFPPSISQTISFLEGIP